ncbi:hypothetical protein H5410_061353 [Solanum commersonii]|uniref:Uncharacterized protein n=1 Tax=Solanum commersonii TaxID=4109 RepID=A0A9J5W7H8_SOLCO|nr:hypothetical protein H5410_061353 [Solanum commersonii]
MSMEFWKSIDGKGIKWLIGLFSVIFKMTKVPQEWRLSTIVSLCKNKVNIHYYNNYTCMKLLSFYKSFGEGGVYHAPRRQSSVEILMATLGKHLVILVIYVRRGFGFGIEIEVEHHFWISLNLTSALSQEMIQTLMMIGAWRRSGNANYMWENSTNYITKEAREVLGVSRGNFGGHQGDW